MSRNLTSQLIFLNEIAIMSNYEIFNEGFCLFKTMIAHEVVN